MQREAGAAGPGFVTEPKKNSESPTFFREQRCRFHVRQDQSGCGSEPGSNEREKRGAVPVLAYLPRRNGSLGASVDVLKCTGPGCRGVRSVCFETPGADMEKIVPTSTSNRPAIEKATVDLRICAKWRSGAQSILDIIL